MVKPVSLSDPAFAALRKEKRHGESDSDVVLRLIDETRRLRKDPMSFLRGRPHREMMDAEEHLQWLDEMREASAYDPWEER